MSCENFAATLMFGVLKKSDIVDKKPKNKSSAWPVVCQVTARSGNSRNSSMQLRIFLKLSPPLPMKVVHKTPPSTGKLEVWIVKE